MSTSSAAEARPASVASLRLGLEALLTGALAAVLLVPVLELWNAELTVPFSRGGDVPFVHMLVKGVIETGGVLENPRLGAPIGQELRDYPEVDVLSLLLLKALAAVSSDPPVVLNLFLLLSFPLCAMAAFLVLRGRVGVGPAIVAAVLFAYLPYHLSRGQSHLFLAAYWAVPAIAHLMLVLLSGRPAFVRREAERGRLRAWASRRTLATLTACVVIGCTWSYYALYGVLLVGAAAALAVIVRPDRGRVLREGGLIVAATAAVLTVNVLPYALHRADAGENEVYAVRQPQESEQYSLKLMQLITPIEGHRIDRLGRFSRFYGSTAPSGNEGERVHLGAIGAFGFVTLLLVAAAGGLGLPRTGLMARAGPVAAATLITFLFATNGGLGSLIGYLVTPQLRAWNRLSIVIGFLALLAVALALDAFARRWVRGPAFAGVLALVLVGGVVDQTSRADVPAYAARAAEEGRAETYAADVERRLPRGASVFQLPYVSFPEGQALGRLPFYAQLSGYLHSDRLRWSYGDVVGRPEEWRDDLAGRSAPEVAARVAAVGFSAIEVARPGYSDGGARLEADLRRITGQRPLVAPGGDVALYDLRSYADRLRRRTPPERLSALREQTLRPQDSPARALGLGRGRPRPRS